MKITILGGAGAMSKAIIKDFVEDSKDVSEILIADINEKEGKRFAEEIASRPGNRVKISAVYLDVYDHDKLVETVKDSDAALDATHQDCGPAAAKGVIDAKVNGCALGSDYANAQKTLEYDKLAKEAGVTYVVAAGTFPGGTNLAAKYLAHQMDEVEDIHISMILHRPITLTPSLVDLFVSYMVTAGVMYKGGKLEKTTPFSGKEVIEFPKPFGKQTVYNIISSEPVTIPLAIKGVKNVCTKATYHSDYTEMLKTCYKLGLCSTKQIEVEGKQVTPKGVFKALLYRRPVEEGREVVRFAQRVKVTGKKDGKPIERVIIMPFLPFEGQREDPETRATGDAGSIIVQMLAKGVKEKGVMGPESCLNPKEFMEEWARRRGVEILES